MIKKEEVYKIGLFNKPHGIHGELGEGVEVDTATVNTLFVVEQEDGEELLIPAQEEFIVEINQEKKLITVELPEGLLNLEDLEED